MTKDITEFVSRADIDAELVVVDYVAGRLADSDRVVFERLLETDEDLARRVSEERALSAALSPLPGVGVPTASAFERLRDTLEAPQPRRQMPTAIAAAVAMLAVAVLVLRPGPETAPVFEGLSDATEQPVGAGQVRLVFAPETDATARDRIAASLGFEIVSGPGPAGAFVVRPIDAATPDLTRWRAHEAVVLAEPIGYGP